MVCGLKWLYAPACSHSRASAARAPPMTAVPAAVAIVRLWPAAFLAPVVKVVAGLTVVTTMRPSAAGVQVTSRNMTGQRIDVFAIWLGWASVLLLPSQSVTWTSTPQTPPYSAILQTADGPWLCSTARQPRSLVVVVVSGALRMVRPACV